MKIKLLVVYAVLACFVFAGEAVAKNNSVTGEVKKTVDEVIRIVTDKNLKKPGAEKKRRAELRVAIGSLFDYSEMTKRALGRHWRELSPADRTEITGLFTDLLEHSYAGKIESYNNEKVLYVREDIDEDYAEVKSKVISVKHDEFSVNYRLLNENGKWRVYDVVIEGVSLVSNYRSQFNRIISEKGYDGLVKKLRAKSQEIKNLSL
jgi:phospholipid transport system substrate-binding protein